MEMTIEALVAAADAELAEAERVKDRDGFESRELAGRYLRANALYQAAAARTRLSENDARL